MLSVQQQLLETRQGSPAAGALTPLEDAHVTKHRKLCDAAGVARAEAAHRAPARTVCAGAHLVTCAGQKKRLASAESASPIFIPVTRAAMGQ